VPLREIINMAKLDNQTIQLLIFGAIALALLLQAIVLFALFIAMSKAAKAMTGHAKNISEKIEGMSTAVMPIVENTRDLLVQIKPKIVDTSTDIAALTTSLRVQTADVQSAATEILARVRTQSGRIDSLLTSTLDALERATGFMAETLTKPMRQLGAFLASAKAVVDSLRNSEPPSRSQRNPSSSDSDLFV
jgi:hypothetical protein